MSCVKFILINVAIDEKLKKYAPRPAWLKRLPTSGLLNRKHLFSIFMIMLIQAVQEVVGQILEYGLKPNSNRIHINHMSNRANLNRTL